MVEHERQVAAGAGQAPVAEPPVSGEHPRVEGRTQRQIVWRRFRRHRLALVGGVVLLFLYAAAILTPWIAPYGYDEIDVSALNQPPSLEHPMGTDRLGRDELTRVLYGGRVSLMVGLCVGVFSTLIGATVGIVSGYYGRFVDSALMGFTDYMLVLPFLPLLLVLGSLFSFTPVTITLALVLLLWMDLARLVRGQVLSLRDQEFVLAARAIGVSDLRIMARHILPNVVGVLVVKATLAVALAILLESAISYLGFGIQPPTPSWGNMLTDARATMTTQWWLTVFPGLMIVITALCVNFLGDGLRDALDPKAVE
ncbi:binding-protein-dependent transport systems inner membrane component [Rubrobacter xylanophilus DSM 9941]|uniref:Oligopeptide transport system permease protein OppC n=1 Tax=Rubrobacter xylanophilus (strain DSM 9941 / JCM 11954 / NBRC 16129 / PRD-1) TaxID=266117 RepID=Q1AXN7_RUBXD|nr:oligopeptide ABC transporter permease [Rubrobacter xylanophilus]ABG03841.1 binding-protein-dependent transport systems inner membrane component [Rubrobacter xylanophilus DSM 9941]